VRLRAQPAAPGVALAVEDAAPNAALGPLAAGTGALRRGVRVPRHVCRAQHGAAARDQQRGVVSAGLRRARALCVRGARGQGCAREEGVRDDSPADVAGGDVARALAQRQLDAAVLEHARARAGPAHGGLRLRARQQGQDGVCRGLVIF